jgi:ATP-dependent DNA helicase RecG
MQKKINNYKNPQRFFPQAIIKIGRFINDADIVSSDIVEGNLFQQAENTLAILKTKYLISPNIYEGIHRRELLEYPYEALREAVFNALIHRDYNTTSAIQIKIYNNSLSIANEGKLPPEITIADLRREHLSKPRNKLLADIFYKAGNIETWGMETLKIIRECKIAHIPEPTFYEQHGVVKIVFELAGDTVKFQNGELNYGQTYDISKTRI